MALLISMFLVLRKSNNQNGPIIGVSGIERGEIMDACLAGLLAGLAAVPVWFVTTFLIEGAFVSVFRQHRDLWNYELLSKPALSWSIVAAELAFYGAVFGFGYALVYSAISWSGAIGSGLVWGTLMLLSYSRGTIESIIWTKTPKDMHLLGLLETLVGLLAWGAALGPIFASLV